MHLSHILRCQPFTSNQMIPSSCSITGHTDPSKWIVDGSIDGNPVKLTFWKNMISDTLVLEAERHLPPLFPIVDINNVGIKRYEGLAIQISPSSTFWIKSTTGQGLQPLPVMKFQPVNVLTNVEGTLNWLRADKEPTCGVQECQSFLINDNVGQCTCNKCNGSSVTLEQDAFITTFQRHANRSQNVAAKHFPDCIIPAALAEAFGVRSAQDYRGIEVLATLETAGEVTAITACTTKAEDIEMGEIQETLAITYHDEADRDAKSSTSKKTRNEIPPITPEKSSKRSRAGPASFIACISILLTREWQHGIIDFRLSHHIAVSGYPLREGDNPGGKGNMRRYFKSCLKRSLQMLRTGEEMNCTLQGQ